MSAEKWIYEAFLCGLIPLCWFLIITQSDLHRQEGVEEWFIQIIQNTFYPLCSFTNKTIKTCTSAGVREWTAVFCIHVSLGQIKPTFFSEAVRRETGWFAGALSLAGMSQKKKKQKLKMKKKKAKHTAQERSSGSVPLNTLAVRSHKDPGHWGFDTSFHNPLSSELQEMGSQLKWRLRLLDGKNRQLVSVVLWWLGEHFEGKLKNKWQHENKLFKVVFFL